MRAEAAADLRAVSERLTGFVSSAQVHEVEEHLELVGRAAEAISRSASGSWIGYQSRIYYEGLQPVPPGARYSSEWGDGGIRGPEHVGNWVEFDGDEVKSAIFSRAGVANLEDGERIAKAAKELFDRSKLEAMSILQGLGEDRIDPFLKNTLDGISSAKILLTPTIRAALAPKGVSTRDSLAASQGIQTPPHVDIAIEIAWIQGALRSCRQLAQASLAAASHLERVARDATREARIGTNVFIGHGRSGAWKELRDFIRDRVGLPWDEFNRVPVAGITNIARLSEMLDAAALALLVMTAEDERADGGFQARLNVVHEAGLF